MTDTAGKTVIIGAGIVGVATAIWLQRAGQQVTLVDRVGPAGGASFGNGGVLASIAVVPVPVPGLLAKAPKMLLSNRQPLFLRWGYLPALMPFLSRYLQQGKAQKVNAISKALTTMLHDCPDQHLALARGTPAEDFVKPGSYLFGYPDRQAFEADGFAWGIRKKRGYRFRELTADDLAAHDPALAGRFGFGVECEGHGIISDPGAYVSALADHVRDQGGTVVTGELRDFDIRDGRARAAITDHGEIEAETFVLATGAWSGPLARTLGISVPLESERGYHVEFINPSITLRSPIMVAAGKFVTTSMNGRLRCAGVVEFGGLKAGPSKGPINLLKRNIAELFPDLTYDRTEEWMGHRPATADSIPVVGRTPAAENVFVGYGHHHVGMSGGPRTGRWLAQMITDEPVNTDLSAFSPARKI